MKKETNRIIIIDSGVTLPQQSENESSGIFLEKLSSCKYRISSNIQDEIGHGTGIYGIIKQHNSQADIFSVKICDKKNNSPQTEDLIYALSYISSNIECKIINMCLSLSMTDDIQSLKKLEEICEQLNARDIILVSAFDNWGSLSYPAAFRSVIGVTAGSNCHKSTDIEYVENDIVNICGYGAEQKVLSNNGGYTVSRGNSLACAHITGTISQFIESNMTKSNILNELKTLAINHHNEYAKSTCTVVAPVSSYKKAIIFPFNKETHSLIRYQEMLNFTIEGVYDTKFSGYVHSTTNSLLHINKSQNHTIQNVEKIDYQSFDTLILGHTDQIEKIVPINKQIKKLIQNCINTKKNIFSFDDRSNQIGDYPHYFSPQTKKEMIIKIPFGKLYRNPKPVLGVFGTSSHQGKFSLQLILRKHLSDLGYAVGQIGTEPTSILFGMDAGFHFGYNTTTDVFRYDTVSYLNQKIYEIVKKDVDLIIVGCQSRSLPVDYCNLNNFTFPQEEFLFAVQPDIFILCVNPWDDLDYIDRTIRFLESAVCGRVIALVVYPYDLLLNPEETSYEMVPLTDDQYDCIKLMLEKKFSVPVYHLDHNTDHSLLVQVVLDSLS